MTVYLMVHGKNTPVQEKKIDNLQEFIDRCKTKIMGRVGFSIFKDKRTIADGMTTYDTLVLQHNGIFYNKYGSAF